jgi:hypothetical protein
MRRLPKFIKPIVLFVLAILILFPSFYKNQWHILDQESLQTNQLLSDHYIMGRLLKSHRDGVFSAGGLVGFVEVLPDPSRLVHRTYPYQLDYFVTNQDFVNYLPYESQIGGQGMLFSILDEIIPKSPQATLRLFYLGTSFLSAVLLTLLILWFYQEFGFSVALLVLVTTAFSQWLIDFGKSLFWSFWAFYLPLVTVAYYLKFKKLPVTRKKLIWFGILIFVVVFIKFLFNGYEFNTTAAVMMAVPIVYYCILERVNWRQLANISLTAILSTLLAVLVSFVILCIQIGSVEGSFSKGIDHIIFSFQKRTYADPQTLPSQYSNSLKASPISVLFTYLDGVYVDLNNFFSAPNKFVSESLYKIKYWYLIVLFAIASVFLYFSRKRPFYKERINLVLVCATWFSILAPLSWYIIFKSHAYIHKFDTIVWQMPFTFLGFAVCGLAFKNILLDLNHRARQIIYRA